jgi:hypothetical protein
MTPNQAEIQLQNLFGINQFHDLHGLSFKTCWQADMFSLWRKPGLGSQFFLVSGYRNALRSEFNWKPDN